MIAENTKLPPKLTVTIVYPDDMSNPRQVKLTELSQDKTVILYFYPKDSTPGCTTESLAFRDHLPEIEKNNALVVGCSRDTVKSHCSFITKQKLNFPLISDEGELSEFFGVWAEKSMYGRKFMGILRSTFVLEKGKVIKIFEKVNVKDHAKEIVSYLQSR